MEEWRSVVGYEGLYEVSNTGNVRNVRRNKLLKPVTNKGYLRVCLCKKGKTKNNTIHRMVAQAFIPNPDELPMINHKDEDKTNNNVTNLEWCDAKYNSNYGNRTKKLINTRVKNGYNNLNFIGFGLNEKDYMKQYNRIYREKLKEYKKRYYQEHKEKLDEKNKERTKVWREKNRERYNEWQREYRLKKKNE